MSNERALASSSQWGGQQATRDLTQEDVNWLVDSIKAIKPAYRKKHFFKADVITTLEREVNELATIYASAVTASSDEQQKSQARKTFFIEVIKKLEEQLKTVIDRHRLATPADYQKIIQEKKYYFDKMLATLLAAIYKNYPELQLADELALSQRYSAFPRNLLITYFSYQGEYGFKLSPRESKVEPVDQTVVKALASQRQLDEKKQSIKSVKKEKSEQEIAQEFVSGIIGELRAQKIKFDTKIAKAESAGLQKSKSKKNNLMLSMNEDIEVGQLGLLIEQQAALGSEAISEKKKDSKDEKMAKWRRTKDAIDNGIETIFSPIAAQATLEQVQSAIQQAKARPDLIESGGLKKTFSFQSDILKILQRYETKVEKAIKKEQSKKLTG